MSLPHVILGMLRKQPQSGYDLNKQLEASIQYFWDTDISRIYRSLAAMEKKGWVVFETVLQTDGPKKKVYNLTRDGRRELEAWLSEPGMGSGARNPFLAQLHFSDAVPVQAQLNVLKRRLAELEAALGELERRAVNLGMPVPLPPDALAQGVTREMFSLEYGIRRYRFEIEWTENTIKVLERAA
jgi:DNA-binding PadR family transcriptional regulator